MISADEILKKSYLSGDYLLPDGMPLVWLTRFFSTQKNSPIRRLTGVDATEAILRDNSTIFVIGSSALTVRKIRQQYANLRNIECEHLQFDLDQVNSVSESLFEKLDNSNAKFVLVCLGFPKQEILALKFREYNFKQPKVFFCVGGSLDMLSGRYPRAPKKLQVIGLEWLWRLKLDFRRLIPRYFLDFLFLVRILPRMILRKLTIFFGRT
jgi:N-acetylglucosaminyldiphosphoundecaprenol N-acetyl-beta-D-mannosaminyltransferase